jgi:hypothetical protein
VSENGGDNWKITAAGNEAQFAGNHSGSSDPVPASHPRSNGNLIVVDNGNNVGSRTDDIVIAGTYKNGVKIFSSGGDTLSSTVNEGGFVRSVSKNPKLSKKAYAAIYFNSPSSNGIYEIDYTNVNSPTSKRVFQAVEPEEVTVLDNGHVYAAIGAEGVVYFDGVSWTRVNTGLTLNSSHSWAGITGYTINNTDVVYVTVNNTSETRTNINYSSVWR